MVDPINVIKYYGPRRWPDHPVAPSNSHHVRTVVDPLNMEKRYFRTAFPEPPKRIRLKRWLVLSVIGNLVMVLALVRGMLN